MPRTLPNLLPHLKVLNNPITRHLSITSKCIRSLPTSIPAQSPPRKPHPFPRIPTGPPSRPLRFYSTSPSAQPPFPITPLCPPSTCACIATPTDLDIDREATLSGTVPAYTQHVLISTGREDWASRITDIDDANAVQTGVLKKELGLGGRFHDPYRPVLITHSSFTPSPSNLSGPGRTSAFLFPSFRYVPDIGSDLQTFIRAFLRPAVAHDAIDEGGAVFPLALGNSIYSVTGTGACDSHSHSHSQDHSHGHGHPYSRPVNELVVLICGHGSRDRRCGVMGPLLRAQFTTVLKAHGFSVASDSDSADENQPPSPVPSPSPSSARSTASPSTLGTKTARVGLTSHIGGHRFAGNVIIYVPLGFEFEGSHRETKEKEEDMMRDRPSAERSSTTLKGMGIWYGRVEPRHVDGIITETVRRGRVVGELFRGAVFGGGREMTGDG